MILAAAGEADEVRDASKAGADASRKLTKGHPDSGWGLLTSAIYTVRDENAILESDQMVGRHPN